FDVEDVVLSADKRSVLYTSNQNDVDRRHIWRVGATGGEPEALTRGETIEWNPVETSDGKTLLCLGSTATSPAMPYRVTSSGRAFREPPNSVWRGASEYQDVVAGAKFLQTLDNVDPQRIGLWGGSYGGFLTATGLARNSDIFKAGVDFHGVHDWATFLPMWVAEVDAKK